MQWRKERRVSRKGKAIDLIGAGINCVITHTGQYPREDKIVRLNEAAIESRRRASNESNRKCRSACKRQGNQRSSTIDGKQIVIVSVHVEAVNLERTVIES